MKAMIVEDSQLARAELRALLKEHPHIHLCGEAESPFEALPLIQKEHPDILFLDINMPGKNGFQLLEELDYEPKVIFTTAYSDYAIRSFEFDTVDYLLKPISAERFKKAIDKISLSPDHAATENDTQRFFDISAHVLLRDGEQHHWVCLRDIQYFESHANHTLVFWGTSRALIYRALSKIEPRLPEKYFFRVSRQHIINIEDVVSVEPWVNGGYRLHMKTEAIVEVSRRHSARFKDAFSL